jgi:hypothetical protein
MKYASFLRISRALHLNVFDQPVKKQFFNNLLEGAHSIAAGRTAQNLMEPFPALPGGIGRVERMVYRNRL